MEKEGAGSHLCILRIRDDAWQTGGSRSLDECGGAFLVWGRKAEAINTPGLAAPGDSLGFSPLKGTVTVLNEYFCPGQGAARRPAGLESRHEACQLQSALLFGCCTPEVSPRNPDIINVT